MTTLNEQIHQTFEGKDLEKALALVEALELDLESDSEIFKTHWDNKVFQVDGREYLVLDEEERDRALKIAVEQSLWAFNSSFLAEATSWDLEVVFETMRDANLCEESNEAILAIVNKFSTLETLAKKAVQYDGYGHFLSPYDGEELDANVGESYYLIYRQG